MGIPKLKYDQFTYADYLTWNDGKRWEIINGKAYDMSPSPNTEHQRISMLISVAISNFIKGKPCSVFSAPFDVRLAEKNETEEETIHVVQPDIIVVCDPSKIDDRGIKGAPDWIIEITSPSMLKHDFGIKLLLYQKYKVREYWIIDPETKTVHIFTIDISGKYNPGSIYKDDDIMNPGIFPEFTITPKDIFHN